MDGLITFIIITLLIIIVPGPDFIIVMKNTINSSKMNGFMAAFGITTGHILYSSLAILELYTYLRVYTVFNNKNIGCLLSYLSRNQKYFECTVLLILVNKLLADVRNVSYITSFRQGFKYKS